MNDDGLLGKSLPLHNYRIMFRAHEKSDESSTSTRRSTLVKCGLRHATRNDLSLSDLDFPVLILLRVNMRMNQGQTKWVGEGGGGGS